MDSHVDPERVPAREEAVAHGAGHVLVAGGRVGAQVRRQRRLERELLVAHLAHERTLARVDPHVAHQVRLFPAISRKLSFHPTTQSQQ